MRRVLSCPILSCAVALCGCAAVLSCCAVLLCYCSFVLVLKPRLNVDGWPLRTVTRDCARTHIRPAFSFNPHPHTPPRTPSLPPNPPTRPLCLLPHLASIPSRPAVPPSVTSSSQIQIIDDDKPEGKEKFRVQLTGAIGCTIKDGGDLAVVTIANDDVLKGKFTNVLLRLGNRDKLQARPHPTPHHSTLHTTPHHTTPLHSTPLHTTPHHLTPTPHHTTRRHTAPPPPHSNPSFHPTPPGGEVGVVAADG